MTAHLSLVKGPLGYQPTRRDLDREARMRDILLEMHHEPDRDKARALFCQYRELHEKRGPEYVAYLEKRQGIFRGN